MLGPELSREVRAELERRLAEHPAVVQGDLFVPRDSALTGPVLVLEGTVTFAGRAPSGVTVVKGDFFLRPGADVAGDVVVVGGRYYGSALGAVRGERRVLGGPAVVLVRGPGHVTVSAERVPAPFPVALGAPAPLSDSRRLHGVYGFFPEAYNRVDGLGVRWGIHYVPAKDDGSAPRIWAQVVLRTSRDDVGWEAGVEREFRAPGLSLRASGYSLTDTGERWHRGDVETGLAALFLGEDNRFYFERRGVEGRLRKSLGGPLSLSLAVRNDEIRSLRARDPFSVAEDDFLSNPAVREGTLRSALAAIEWGGEADPEGVGGDWRARLEGEAAGGALGGDFDFTSARLDVRRSQPLGPHRLDARLVLAGRVGGALPEQERFHLGGAATLPGYEALSVNGDRMAILNLRYRVPLPAVRRLRPFARVFGKGAWVMVLADGGDAWVSRRDDPHWLESAGIGFAGRGTLGDVGVYAVVPSERIRDDQSDVSVFLYFGKFF